MYSVTARIRSIRQPMGGYIKPSDFKITDMNDGTILNSEENIHGTIVGMAVDYLTRFAMGTDVAKAFHISLEGSAYAEIFGEENSIEAATALLNSITGLDDTSVISACKLVTFDAWRRNPMSAKMAKGYKDINPDKATIQNVQTFVNRSVLFFDKYGPIVRDGITFEPVKTDNKAYEKMRKSGKGSYGGYTPTVSSGDGDFLTADTLWDFKVSKSKPTSKNTLQLLMYWIMGQHSGQEIYKKVTKLGIFNPRLNLVYLLDMKDVPAETIKTVESEVICYE